MPRGYQLPEVLSRNVSVKIEHPATPPYHSHGRSHRSLSWEENYPFEDQIDPSLLPREHALFQRPLLPTIKSPATEFNPGYEHATANHFTYTHHHNIDINDIPPYMSNSAERGSPPVYPHSGYDRGYETSVPSNTHLATLEPSLRMYESTSNIHNSSDVVASGAHQYILEYAPNNTVPVAHHHDYPPATHDHAWYDSHHPTATTDGYRNRYDLNGHHQPPINALPNGYLQNELRPAFTEAYCGLDNSISPVAERPRALLPQLAPAPSYMSRAVQPNGIERFTHGYMSTADISPHFYAPSSVHQHDPRPSTIDPALPLPPPRSESTAKKTLKAKPSRRKSSRRDPIAPAGGNRVNKRSNNQMGIGRIEFEAALEPGEVPGCYILTPTLMGPPDDQAGFNGPKPMIRRAPKEKCRRKPMTEEERAAVKANRLNGVCFRCKIFKEKCRGGYPCDRCSSIPLWRPICVTMQFVDKQVFSRGLYCTRAMQQFGNVKEWLNVAPRLTMVSNGLQPVLNLWVKEYVPVDESILDHILWRGDDKSSFKRFPSTAFGIKDEASLTPDLDRYIDEHIPILLKIMNEEGLDKVYVDTLHTAYNYFKKGPMQGDVLLHCALRIWVAQMVFFKRPWRFAQQCDSLGMGVITAQDSPKQAGIRPLPRLLNQALDSLMEKRAAYFEQQFLAELQTRIFRRQPNEWFGIFLAVFVFLSGMEKDTWTLETWNTEVVKHRDNPNAHLLAWPLPDTPNFLAEKNRHLVDILVAHFRAVCKGQIPFKLDWGRSEYQAMAGNDPTAIRYMTSVGADIKSRPETFVKARLSSQYERTNPESLDMTFSCRLMYQFED